MPLGGTRRPDLAPNGSGAERPGQGPAATPALHTRPSARQIASRTWRATGFPPVSSRTAWFSACSRRARHVNGVSTSGWQRPQRIPTSGCRE